ncbi:maleylacetate reductase [Amycolatopsis rhabdoformis]|uniref:Maleylacetate reductase n=1 Tax=Amycolatopsis rhabdoformis TaxID=1448059 RepID=A0ABZ1IDH6_9PSEU|nr:maleylacetate reductase [Amycolatopsis rhabdoformis]WSE32317.1 maleylacetate reductase [Amycolatopsis rhabdoformis]
MNAPAYEALPARVVFGAGSVARLAEETDHAGLRRVLVLCTPTQRGLAGHATAILGERAVGVFEQARMHVPLATISDALVVAAELGADGCVAAGGGSTIGLAKALSLRAGLPYVALPTTYAGSEMTPIWGLTEDFRKLTGRDRSVLPRAVVYDPELTATVPAATAVTSGLNAIAHAVEALYAPDSSPPIAAMAERGIRDLVEALPVLGTGTPDAATRATALQGAWLCGTCLGATTMGLHHKVCHVLGGLLDLPHAETHAAMLPHVAAFNLPAAPDAAAAVRRALNAPDAAAALSKLVTESGAPSSLAELGVRRSQLRAVAEETLITPYANPRPINRQDLLHLLEKAWSGTPA